MRVRGSQRRARPSHKVWLAAFLALLAAPFDLTAQVPSDTVAAPTDTIPQDTPRVPGAAEVTPPDTVPDEPADTAAEPILRIHQFPSLGPGWDVARWEWDADELARLPGLTVLEFVERTPGVARFGVGGFGRPEALTALGMGGARTRVVLNGFELDPQEQAAYPLETLSVLDIRRLRVERTLSEIRIDIETFELASPEPFSVVELGTGVFQTRVLRALFSRGFGSRVVATGVFDLASTGGIGIREPYRHLNALLRWDFVPTESFGLQLEWRRTIVDREGTEFPQQTTRGDLILRARASPTERLILEAIVGRTSAEDEAEETFVPPTSRTVQVVGRAAYATERFFAEVGVRGRRGRDSTISRPAFESQATVAFIPVPQIRIEGDVETAVDEGLGATRGRLTGTLGLAGLSVFGSIQGGTQLLSVLVPPGEIVTDEDPEQTEEPALFHFESLESDAAGFRAGAELAGWFGSVGVAAFRTQTTPVAPFSLPFDLASPVVEVGSGSGIESYATLRVPGTRGMLQLNGAYSRFADYQNRPYTPADVSRLALVFHGEFIGGQLEPSIMLEGMRRGPAVVPPAPGEGFEFVTPALNALNFALHLRILDVRAFILWDNLLRDPNAVLLPGAPPPTTRVVYGASWQFLN